MEKTKLTRTEKELFNDSNIKIIGVTEENEKYEIHTVLGYVGEFHVITINYDIDGNPKIGTAVSLPTDICVASDFVTCMSHAIARSSQYEGIPQVK